MFTMKILTASLVFCTILTISQAGSMKPNMVSSKKADGWPSGSSSSHDGLCANKRQHCSNSIGSYCPQCDANGNFLPQQVWGSTGYTWCVNIYTGEAIPNTMRPPTATPIDCEGVILPCPHGWSPFGQKCFIFKSSPNSWTEAQAYCKHYGANLASIHSKEENHFVQSLTNGGPNDFPESWIGGTDCIYPGYWMWSDGSEFNYEDWDRDIHHDMDMGNCLKISRNYNVKWSHAACKKPLPFVCSKNI